MMEYHGGQRFTKDMQLCKEYLIGIQRILYCIHFILWRCLCVIHEIKAQVPNFYLFILFHLFK